MGVIRNRIFSRFPTVPIAMAALLLAGFFLLTGWGCSHPSSDRMQAEQESFFANVRPVCSDTSQLLRNAHYYRLMGRPEMALKQLELAHQQEPKNIKIINELARGYEDSGDFDRAQSLYRKGLEVDSSNQALTNNLCFSYYLAGKWDEAESSFRKALTQNPGNIAARNNLGLLLCRRGRAPEAFRLWREAEGEKTARDKMVQVLAALDLPASTSYAKERQTQAVPGPVAAAKPKNTSGAAKPLTAQPSTAGPSAAATRPQPPALAAAQPPAAKSPEAAPSHTSQPAARTNTEGNKTAPAPAIAAPAATSPATPARQAAVRAAEPATTPTLARDAAAAPSGKPAPPAAGPATSTASTAASAPAKPAQQKSAAAPKPARLSDLERSTAGIEVRNGAGKSDLARETRSILTELGCQVVAMGNHQDFGVEQTTIYYRAEAGKTARVLAHGFFPKATLEVSQNLAPNVKVKVLLGKELLEGPLVVAFSALDESPAEAPVPRPVVLAPKSAPLPAPPAIASNSAAFRKMPLNKVAAVPVLTANELGYTAIELRNGAGITDLAHTVRARLSQEGFEISSIGNHIDFGVQQTLIYYRPKAERVAQALSARFFPIARMKQSTALSPGIDIKVLMGKDLVRSHDLMAKLEGVTEPTP